ncbi:MAG: ATP-binding protein [Pseudomonadota bacterium]
MTLAQQGTPALPETDHAVRFYTRDEQLLDEVTDFLDAALRAGGLAVAITTAEHGVQLRQRLSGFGGPLDRATTWVSGRFVLLDASETLALFMVDGRPEPAAFEAVIGPVLAQAPPGSPLHAFGEMVAVLCEAGDYEAALALEALWNDIAAKHRFSLFCAYPRRLFSSADKSRVFRHVCAAHTQVLDVPYAAPSPPPDGEAEELAGLRRHAAALQAEVERRKAAEQVLRQRERELAEFLENAGEGIHKVAGDGTILYANRAELEMLGYQWQEYVGHNIAEFYPDQAAIGDILRRLGCGDVLRDQPAVLRCKDGSSKPVLICSNACFENGKLVYTRCFTRDASEAIARQQALERSAAEREQLLQDVRESSRAKDEFLAMLGHELRNPLSPIVTALQLMRMRGDTGTAREQAIIQRQVDHMVRLVDDLLDISRITRGKIDLQRERTDLSGVLSKAVEQASPLLEQRRHRLDIQVEPDLLCDCDPTRISQVVANLLTNAARYTDAGGEIALRASRAARQWIAISVRDNGSGIPSELLPKVFELFYQAPRGLARSEGGLGVGLALVQSLVQLHGGTVQAFSEGKGRGSEFVIRLPALPARAPRIPRKPAAARSRPKVPAPAFSPSHILLVDDNEDAARTLAELLRSVGHQVAVHTDPVTALDWLESHRPEVAILDIGLPVIDGYELGLKIRERCGPACRLIALTGYGQDADKARATKAGFNHHLTKPVSPGELLAHLAL